MERIVAGLDPSLTGFAVCRIAENGIYQCVRFTSQPTGKLVADRINRALVLVANVLAWMELTDAPAVICIEGYSHGSNVPGVVERVELGGILRADLLATFPEATLCEVAPVQLKKFVTGSGRGDKTAVIAALTKRYGVEFTDSDRYDAYGLARVAACLAGVDQPSNDAQRDVLRKLQRNLPYGTNSHQATTQ